MGVLGGSVLQVRLVQHIHVSPRGIETLYQRDLLSYRSILSIEYNMALLKPNLMWHLQAACVTHDRIVVAGLSQAWWRVNRLVRYTKPWLHFQPMPPTRDDLYDALSSQFPEERTPLGLVTSADLCRAGHMRILWVNETSMIAFGGCAAMLIAIGPVVVSIGAHF